MGTFRMYAGTDQQAHIEKIDASGPVDVLPTGYYHHATVR